MYSEQLKCVMKSFRTTGECTILDVNNYLKDELQIYFDVTRTFIPEHIRNLFTNIDFTECDGKLYDYMGLVGRKPVFGCVRQSELQTSLLSYRDQLENLDFTCSKFTYNTHQNANSKGVDRTARMRRLVSVCVVRKHPKKIT